MKRSVNWILGFILLLCGTGCALVFAQTSRPPNTTRPPLTPQQWREDLQFALNTFLPRDRSFSPAAREQFRRAIAMLDQSLETKSEAQIVVELAKAIALAHNAHTRLYLLRNRTELRRYPIRVWWFADGLYVVRARPESASLLGARIVRLAGRPVEQVKRAVAPLYSGNASWRDYMSTYTMTSPDILIGLGLIGGEGKTEIEYVSRRGKKGRHMLSPLPFRPSDQPVESWWDLAPTRPRDDGDWVSALKVASARLPFYLRDTEKQYWSRYLAEARLFYLQFNRAGNAPGQVPFSTFGAQTLADLRELKIRKLVVDLRFNSGGDLNVARPFFEQLAALAKERRAKVYVLTGRTTFSAGLYHALQLREQANALFVGENVGDELDFWAEGGNAIAPNSKLSLHYADRLHSYSPASHPEFEQYLVTDTDLNIANASPDLPIKMSARDYFMGHDPALEAVLRHR